MNKIVGRWSKTIDDETEDVVVEVQNNTEEGDIIFTIPGSNALYLAVNAKQLKELLEVK